MTIGGIGVDIVDIPEFSAQLDEPGTRFATSFTPAELSDSHHRRSLPARHLAVRWAAKEAVIKAWSGAMFGDPPVLGELIHRDIEVITDAWGRPRIRLHGDIANHLDQTKLHVSLSHDGDYAIAYVVLEA